MADRIRVSLRGGPDIIETTPGAIKKRAGVERVEVGQGNRPERLVFYTDPSKSTVQRDGPFGTLVVDAWIPCFFLSDPVHLEIELRNNNVQEVRVGSRNITNLWRAWNKNQGSFSVPVQRRPDPPKSPLEEKVAGDNVELLSRLVDRPQGAGQATAYDPSLSAVLKPFGVKSGNTPVFDMLTLVLESRAILQGRLTAYGAGEEARGWDVRLVQLPDPFQQDKDARLNPRTWFVGVLGLPYSWGQVIWYDRLGEQIRASQFDIQHGALFTPLLALEKDHPLQWDVAFKVTESLNGPLQILLHAVRMTSAEKNRLEEVSFPLLQSHLGSSIHAKLPIAQGFRPDKEVKNWSDYEQLWTSLIGLCDKPGLSLGLRQANGIVCSGTPEARSVRIGALDLTFCESSSQPMESEPELRWQLVESSYPEISGTYQPDESFINLDWAVESALPGGQDDLPDEIYVDCDQKVIESLRPEDQSERNDIECRVRRERPLVIPLQSRGAGPAKDFPKQTLILNVQERARSKDARRIDLTLTKLPEEAVSTPATPATPAALAPGAPGASKAAAGNSPSSETCAVNVTNEQDSVVVLDREPFLVAKVNFPPLGVLKNDAEGGEVANWSNHLQDAGTWHILFPNAQSFCLTLPPQGVGETMEKRRDLDDNSLADFRLSPPAFLALQERYYKQNFPTAPWNLRRLLNDPTRELPGAQLEHLQYELLYGLSCRIDYPFMRFAEISSLIGEVVGPLPTTPSWTRLEKDPKSGGPPTGKPAADAYRRTRVGWALTSQKVRQRLGIFELWDLSRLDTLELKEGVTCWIRGSQGSPPMQLGSTMPPADLADPFGGKGGALKGGVTWGFESRNVYNAVMQLSPGSHWPRSSGAEIGRTWLSALGGYGHQMAAFDNWRSKVLVDASMGRTYSYTLERIGRIGVWWNRAKHVIIYQRTVVPSVQFGSLPDGNQDAQNSLAGRAVLRKVEEYVEILQNTRAYPDNPQGKPRSTGFITACSFSDDPNQVIRFHVRSSWGSEVGTIGWKVPIWKPGEIPGDLYPQPVVSLKIMASVNGESMPRKVTIADPQNLFFFTDTTKPPEAYDDPSIDLSNTDNWLPIEGVDYVDQARPQPGQDMAFAEGSLNQASPGDSVLPGGFRPCTFLIEPAEHTVDLLAHREGDPMGAAISSVTLCRAQLGAAKDGLSKAYRDSLDEISKRTADLLRQLPGQGRIVDSTRLEIGVKDFCTYLGEKAKDLTGQVSSFENQLSDNLDLAIQQALQGIDKDLERLIGRAENSEIGKSLTKGLDEVRTLQTAMRKERLKEEISREVALLGQYVNSVLPSPMVLTDAVRAALQEAKQTLDQIVGAGKDFRDNILKNVKETDSFEPLVTGSEIYLARVEQALEHLRRLAESGTSIRIDTAGAEQMIPFLRGAKKVLESLQGKLKSIEDQLPAARTAVDQLRRERDRLQQMSLDLKKSILASLRKATGWVDDVEKAVNALDPKIKALDDLDKDVAELKKSWAGSLEKNLHDTIDQVLSLLPDLPGKETIAFPLQWAAVLRQQKQSLLDALASAAKDLKENAKFKDRLQEWFQLPETVSQKAQNLCSNLEGQLAQLLKDVDREAGAVRGFLEARRDEVLRDFDRVFGDEVRAVKKLKGEVESTADNVLKLARAFGKPPEVSGLKFDRPEVAFFYDELDKHVGLTPVIARAAQVSAVADALKPFGIDLPVKQLGEQLIPEDLKKFDLSSILPNVAGIPLQNLFSGLKMPDAGDSVKVRHGVDQQTRRAWLNVDVGFQAPGNATLFAVGPLAVRINQPYFGAEARVVASVEGVQERQVKGRLSGTWQLQVGGFELISFKETPLEFDEAGRIRFDVDPRNVQMTPALDFINSLLTSLSPGGLTIRFDGSGVVSTLDLPIPDTQIGAFGFSGLRLGASLALRYGGSGSGGFNIGVTASLGRRDAPFNLSIFILGGGGYLELGSRYYPSTGQVEATADLAITASASLAIALGPIRGGVAVYVGVTATYSSLSGGGLYVGLLFMVSGYVSVLSIASATITLRLDAQYQGGALVGQGHLEIRIKICWCFTLEVSESVTYTLGRAGSSKTSALGGPRAVAQIASLAGVSGADLPDLTEFDPQLLKLRVNDYFFMLV